VGGMIFHWKAFVNAIDKLGNRPMKKMTSLCLLIVLTGCTGNVSDLKLPSERRMQISAYLSAKNQTIQLEHLRIELSPHYDKERGRIKAKGEVTLNNDKIPPSAKVYNSSLKVYLCDKEYRVLKKLSIMRTIIKSAKKGIPFELAFPYTNEYTYIAFDYAFEFNYAFA
jgi:hypothetical protein